MHVKNQKINLGGYMKTIGLLGGMSWESSVGYYRAINEGVKNEQVEESHSAEWLADLASFGFQEVDTNKASNVEATERPSIESTRAMLEQLIKATDNELPNFEDCLVL